jgi:hypothetical protein
MFNLLGHGHWYECILQSIFFFSWNPLLNPWQKNWGFWFRRYHYHFIHFPFPLYFESWFLEFMLAYYTLVLDGVKISILMGLKLKFMLAVVIIGMSILMGLKLVSLVLFAYKLYIVIWAFMFHTYLSHMDFFLQIQCETNILILIFKLQSVF